MPLTIEQVEAQLKAKNVDPNSELWKEIMAQFATPPLGLIRTKKGALMLRLTDNRWPFAAYARDWKVVINAVKSGAVEKALAELNILEENPNPETTAHSTRAEGKAA